MPDFPTAIPDIPDPNTSETLYTMHGGMGHVAATKRILDNIKALATKMGIANGTGPPGTAAVLRRTATGQSGWGQVQAADVVAGGTAGRVLRTSDGTAAAWGQAQAGDYAPNSIQNADIGGGAAIAASKLAPGANRSVLTTNSGAAGFTTDMGLAGNLYVDTGLHVGPGVIGAAAGAIRSKLGIFPSNQGAVRFEAPMSGVSVPSASPSGVVVSTAYIGFVLVIDHSSGQCGIFQVMNGANTVVLLVGPATLWGTTPAGVDGKVHCFFNTSSYFLYNGYGVAHIMSAFFLGVGP
jgi:hypothetical protein